ncbi:acyltransferase family protein [Streptomyces sp. NPDC090445]|uniref:acyltransferase family protein n=1 Tax=Streptomyces sp. NPDC090445 TaxID=3365963 RepID=UPI003801C190
MRIRNSRQSRFRWSHGSVAELFSGRDNSLGLLRLILASAVVLSHARILGFGQREFGYGFAAGQTDMGKLSVFGFFVLSGMLVTRSGNRLPVGRFLWHRALRLLPGLWVCLLVTAFAVAPFLYWRQHHDLAGFLGRADGPLEYIQSNFAIRVHQWGISGILDTAQSKGLAHNGSFDGALWSLEYEVLCYLGVALLALAGARAGGVVRARRAVLAVTVLLGCYVLGDALTNPRLNVMEHPAGEGASAAVVGGYVVPLAFYLGFAFAIGALIEVYKERIPVSDPLGVLSCLVLLAALHYGWLYVLGVPALAYLLLWLAIRLPKPFRKVGHKHDYSYGIYIYGFVVEQAVAVLGGARWGLAAYLGICVAGTLVAAALSWHLVERPAMRLKDIGLSRPGVPRQAGRGDAARSTAPAPDQGQDLAGVGAKAP